MNTLFDQEIPKNTNPPDPTEITTTILYLSTQELKEFRQLTKDGMRKMYPEDYRDRNFTDFLLTLLKQYNAETNS